MGLFISMSGVVGATEDCVLDALRAYAENNEGSLKQEELSTEDAGCLVISEGFGGVTVLYPGDFLDWDGAAEYLSKQVQRPVFSFHIHDGDFWMYLLYEDGEIVDQFNPMPDYWKELEDDERLSWKGDAAAIARRIPGLASDHIVKYLKQWNDGMFDSSGREKAYPSDRFYYGDDWQLVDFMQKLGFDYPVDDQGKPHGATYRFEFKSGETS